MPDLNSIVTLVASATPLTAAHGATLGLTAAPQWLAPAKAAAYDIPAHPGHAQILKWRQQLAADRIDVFVTPSGNRVKKLMLSDMDSTIVAEETLDEVAAATGKGEVIAALTARAMRGELDFESTLRQRVEMLAGTAEPVLEHVRAAITFNQGAHTLVAAMKAQGALTVLVSGGFTYFSAYVAAQCGFDRHHANTFELLGGALTGQVVPPVLDKEAKRTILLKYCTERGLSPDDAFTIGDGSNDLPMLQAAGLGIGYRPKPLLLASLDNCIIHGDLTAALYAQGLTP